MLDLRKYYKFPPAFDTPELLEEKNMILLLI